MQRLTPLTNAPATTTSEKPRRTKKRAARRAKAQPGEAPRVESGGQGAPTPPPPPTGAPTTAADIEAFSRNMARVVEQSGRALAAYMRPREQGGKAGGGG